MDLKTFKKEFDKVLNIYLTKKIKQGKSLLKNKDLDEYLEHISTFVFSGGKRIRPYCCYMSYLGSGGKNTKEIMKFCMVFEILHTMALVHDDIIDESPRRHNIPTMHCFITSKLGEKYEKIGKDQALLVGDIIFSRVYELLFGSYTFDEKLLKKATTNVHAMIEEVILGEMIDVHMMTGIPVDEKLIEKKNMFKTASYTFTRPLLAGALLAGAKEKNLRYIKSFGDAIGIAFQVRDDLKDILATEKDKKVFSDIQEGQQTFFTRYIEKNGSKEQKRLLKNMMGKKVNAKEIKLLQAMFNDAGAIKAGKEHIKTYGKKAEKELEKTGRGKNEKKYFLDITKKITDLSI